jgi:hypothetical protein|tara:strand:- start:1004 stop:2089 length:1086 start_codon:yes stop_codon:yes gene_type:complete
MTDKQLNFIKTKDIINYKQLLIDYPWITKNNPKCILSPDSDGFLCGLLTTNFLNGEIVGFYDGKVLIIRNDVNIYDSIFYDMEINRNSIKSIGQHLVTWNNNLLNRQNLSNCINPNNIRKIQGKPMSPTPQPPMLQNFQRKYPFGTIHFLIGILSETGLIKNIKNDAIWPFLFTDGTWNNLFGYTENCLEWINYLRINDSEHLLNKFFCSSDYSFYSIMEGINDFLRKRDGCNAVGTYKNGLYEIGGRNKRTGDKLKLSTPQGDVINLVKDIDLYKIHEKETSRIISFINIMASLTGWEYIDSRWSWDKFNLYKFTKQDFNNPSRNLNNTTFEELIDMNPISLAMTSGDNIQYTIEGPDEL